MNISKDEFKESILVHLRQSLARVPGNATDRDWSTATSMAVKDLITERFINTMAKHNEQNVRRVHYLSLEFLMGRLLSNNMAATGCVEAAKELLNEYGVDINNVIDEEDDMALGNGGLGRLAACFLDSMATLDLPAVGYGIRYEFGLFRQEIENGHQIEHPDSWIKFGNPWEFCHPEYTQTVKLYGCIENVFDDSGNYKPEWTNYKEVQGVAYDVPIAGYGTETVNFLRLWESRSTEDLDLSAFNEGGYIEAVSEKIEGETISKVLYPNDKTVNGKELRLCQQYFFVACSLKDLIRRHFRPEGNSWANFADKVVIQLNDTHPAIAVPELMRILHDEEGLVWNEAWAIVNKVFAYTNHTLLPEALEQWSVALMRRVLPRHAQIIFEINKRHLSEVQKKWPGDAAKKEILSIVQEGHNQSFRMAHLSVVGSFSVNGVAALHTILLKANLFPEFDEFFPGKFNNKTNGVTPRRWLRNCNEELSALITSKIGEGWVKDLSEIRAIEPFKEDAEFRKDFMEIKHRNKVKLAAVIKDLCDVEVDPSAIFDVQIKRLHEYKRQHLNLLHILKLYKDLLDNPDLDIHPRVFIFGAKAAPGYELAKTIIKAINAVGDKVNNDERIKGKLKVVFLPNYRVSLASRIIPASDLSEQISTAGKEASGTGNMKLALNGSLTIGTLDGANVEICEEVGEDNIFIFGNTVEEVEAIQAKGYDPQKIYEENETIKHVVDWIGSNYFTPDEPGVLNSLRDDLIYHDSFMVLADFEAYCEAQEKVDAAYRDKDKWAKMAIVNTAFVDKFSSDRTISDYNNDIWKLEPIG